MKQAKANHSKWLHIRVKEEEYDKIHKRFTTSNCRKLSEYARRVLLDKTIITTHRNQSLDDFMTEMMRLRKELQFIGNNFNQAVKKLHTLQQVSELNHWFIQSENGQQQLLQKVEAIKQKINQISDQWLQ